jgi:hypothetical protein
MIERTTVWIGNKEAVAAEGAEAVKFLYNKYPQIPKAAMSAWLCNQDFVDDMVQLVSRHETVTLQHVYDSMNRIYNIMEYKKKVKKEYTGFTYRLGREALKSIEKYFKSQEKDI